MEKVEKISKNDKKIWLSVALLVIVGAGCFYAGTLVSKGKGKTTGGIPNGKMGGLNGNVSSTKGMRNNASFINGELLSKEDQKLTIKLQNGGSKIVLFANNTEVVKSTSGTLEDLITGSNLMITGTTNDDGSLTAKSIQLRPTGENVPPMGGGVPTESDKTKK